MNIPWPHIAFTDLHWPQLLLKYQDLYFLLILVQGWAVILVVSILDPIARPEEGDLYVLK